MRGVMNLLLDWDGEEVSIQVERYTDPDTWTPDIATIDSESGRDYHPLEVKAICEAAYKEANHGVHC